MFQFGNQSVEYIIRCMYSDEISGSFHEFVYKCNKCLTNIFKSSISRGFKRVSRNKGS